MTNPIRPLLLLGVVLAAGGLAPGCTSTPRRSSSVEAMTSAAERMGQAREAALAAGATAARADAAREKDRVEQADRLSLQAVNEYREALLIANDMPDAWNNMGVQFMHLQDYVAAAEAFTIAMQLSPTDPRPCENLGIVYDRTHWAEESLRYFDMALERSPNYLPALRGAIKAAHLLSEADEKRLGQVRRALMIETDPAMRDFFEREQLRISGRLDQDGPRRTRR